MTKTSNSKRQESDEPPCFTASCVHMGAREQLEIHAFDTTHGLPCAPHTSHSIPDSNALPMHTA